MRDISTFIAEERSLFEGNANNLFANAIGTIKERYEKLSILRNSAATLISDYGELFSDPTNIQPAKIEQFNATAKQKHIVILFEAFLMYGSILCDDIAQMLLYFFGDVRNVKLGSHRKLASNFADYAKSLDLKYDEELVELAVYLESELCDYRDKQLVHNFHPRKLDTLYYINTNNDVQLGYGILLTKATDEYILSKCWGEILEKIECYLELVMELIKQNKEKTRWLKNA